MCEYCEWTNNHKKLINKKTGTTNPEGLQVSLTFGKLGARCYGKNLIMATGVDIHFCPMCGRNLDHDHEKLEEVRRQCVEHV